MQPALTAQQIREKLLAMRRVAPAAPVQQALAINSSNSPAPNAPAIGNKDSSSLLTWNDEQLAAIRLGASLKPFCLIGAAGTGKTTTIKQVIKEILQSNGSTITKSTKNLRVGAPAVALVSFTNRAVRNIKKPLADIPEILPHCLTIHGLLEFYPEACDIMDEQTGEMRSSKRFVPSYTALNPISSLRLVIVDEASMVSTALFKMLHDACPNATFIFIGDLSQLPPVFGDAILGFKLAELPVVELTRVYRQAMTSPIIAFQHNYTLQGRLPGDSALQSITAANDGLIFKPLLKVLDDPENMSNAFADFMRRQYVENLYNPIDDVVLIPYNKGFGTIFINRAIAQWLGDMRKADIYEINAGMATKYFAVGDFVVYNKQEYIIKEITENPKYVGKRPKEHSCYLKRDGTYVLGKKPPSILDNDFASNIDLQFDMLMDSQGEEEVQKAQASHHLRLVLATADEDSNGVSLSAMGEIGNLDWGYCITVHKSQGSEWRKVYLVMTKHHAPMLSRELLYTGMTRAKENLMVIYSPSTGTGKKDSSLSKAIMRQVVPGRTWRDKIEFFKGKYDSYQSTMNAR